MGRLKAELRKLTLADHTLIAFCSDNGPEGKAGNAPGSAGKLRGRKRDLWEGGIRVPGLMEWPARISPGSVTNVPACTSDYLPTICDITGIDYPDRRPLDGISLLPVIEGEMQQRSRPIGFDFGNRSVWMADRYKLHVQRRAGRQKAEGSSKEEDAEQLLLFDIENDPGEKDNLAHQHPDIAERMRSALRKWRESCRQSLAGKDYSQSR